MIFFCMQEIEINSIDGAEILEQLNTFLQGTITEQWGEYVLEFDSSFGKGMIRSIAFDWGVSLVDYDVNFTEDVKIIFNIENAKPIEFIFVSEGSITYENSRDYKKHQFERYQNIIISSKEGDKETYIFPKKIAIKVNFIYVLRKEYSKKKNHNLSFLSQDLLNVFENTDKGEAYNHFGNFNLKIADQIKQLQESYDSGIVRTLSIEGQLNLIMAMQMLEHNNFEKGNTLPDSLTRDEIKKIHELSSYIFDNISEPLTIANLAKQSSMSPKKLQLGFQVLYSKSVNEYVRQLKLEIARDEIKNSELSISEIVYNIGLRSRSYFSKIFYEKYGMLPTDYRKKTRHKS